MIMLAIIAKNKRIATSMKMSRKTDESISI
jgi:hypothetical protein